MTAMQPKIFVASSSEQKDVADAIHANLDRGAEVTVWHQSVFEPSQFALESLLRQLDVTMFAVFVFGPDDVTRMRGVEHSTARDNVILELGLFVGRLGRECCFIVKPHGSDLHLPSDLDGLNPVGYKTDREDKNWVRALAPACGEIGRKVASLHTAALASVQAARFQPRSPYYYIENRATGKYLTAGGVGEPVRQALFSGNDWQRWSLCRDDDGFVYVLCKATGACLDVNMAEVHAGAVVNTWWPEASNHHQQWQLVPDEAMWRLKVRHSGHFLDVYAGESSEQARIVQWSPVDNDMVASFNQKWQLHLAET